MINIFHKITLSIITLLAGFAGVHVTAVVPIQATSTMPIVTAMATTIKPSPVVGMVAPKAVQVPSPSVVPVPAVNPSDYSSYSVLPLNFSKNSPNYVGVRMKVTGGVMDFLASGDRGVNSNYVEVSSNGETFMLEINSSTDYQNATVNIKMGDTVTAYGTIIPSQSFSDAIGIATLISVLDTVRIDDCSGVTSCTLQVGAQTIFPQVSIQSVIDNDFISIVRIENDPLRFEGTILTTQGKVYQILNDPNGGSSLLLMQDPDGSSEGVAVTADTSFVQSNDVKVGSILQINGTLLPPTNTTSETVYYEYGLPNNSKAPFYMDNGTVSVIN